MRTRAKSFHYRHDYYLVTGAFHLQHGLVEPLDVVFQALPIFLVDCEKVGDIFLLDSATHKIGLKEPTQVAKRVDGSRR